MPVRYGNLDLIPAPLVQWTKRFVLNEKGDILYPEYNFVLTGYILKLGSEAGMENVRDEQNDIIEAFSVQNDLLEISAPTGDGSTDIYCYPRVDSVVFNEGLWYDRSNYTINLISNSVSGIQDASAEYVRSASEQWQISEEPNGVYSISHNINAVGISHDAEDGLDIAKSWVENRLVGITSNTITFSGTPANSGILSDNNLVSSNYWNYSLVESFGFEDNSWGASETFIYYPQASGGTREEWSCTVQEDYQGQKMRANVSVQGVLYGLADSNNDASTKYDNALARWGTLQSLVFSRAEDKIPTGYTLDPSPITTSVSHDETQGLVNYNVSYRAIKGVLISGAVEEELEVVDTGQNDIFAEINVPGRANGPVVQYMSTKSLPQRSVSYSAIFAPSGTPGDFNISSLGALYASKPDTDGIFDALEPDGSVDFYISQHQESWNPISKSYSRSVTWVINPEGTAYTGSL
jgi:hypothetical protein